MEALRNWIRRQLKKGKSAEKIRQELRQRGYNDAVIEEMLEKSRREPKTSEKPSTSTDTNNTTFDRTMQSFKVWRTNWKWAAFFVTLLFVITAATYLLWPVNSTLHVEDPRGNPVVSEFNYILHVEDPRGNPVVSEISIKNEKGKTVFSNTTTDIRKSLSKGEYTVTVDSDGFEREKIEINNSIGVKLNKGIRDTVTLDAREVSFSDFSFVDPTGTQDLEPKIRLQGRNVLGDYVDREVSAPEEITYGTYTVDVQTENFERNLALRGTSMLVNGVSQDRITLRPDEKFIQISQEEKRHIFNFLQDYLRLSSEGVIPNEDRGFPEQFYLYGKDEVVSLGDMIFLSCETATSQNSDGGALFIPKKISYHVNESLKEEKQGCYTHLLQGEVPETVDNASVAAFLQSQVSRTENQFEIETLNSNKRVAELAFSYDIESGRYVHGGNKDDKSISPCDGGKYALGLSDDEVVCDNANKLPWFTPLSGPNTYGNYSYPVGSGLTGWNDILSYSEEYGVPITHYVVVRDYKAFQDVGSPLPQRFRELANDGLIEVGSHTYYHSRLSTFNVTEAADDLRSSKEFLENETNATVVGFRAPYNSIVDNNNYTALEQVLNTTGYTYFSNRDVGFESPSIESKPFNLITYKPISKLKDFPIFTGEIVGIAHPWNLYYDTVQEKGQTHLKQNVSRARKERATLLVAISHGGIPSKVKNMNLE